MMRISFIHIIPILIILNCLNLYSDTICNNVVFIKGECFKGTIFEEKYDLSDDFYYFDSIMRWTPSSIDIKIAEKKLRKCIKLRMISSLRRKKDYYYINKRLKYYRRQYVGIIADSKKFIFLNCYINYPFEDTDLPDKSIVFVLGGGANNFNCYYDCKSKRIKSIFINAPE